MGREVKKVSPDFDWPLKKTWEGYRLHAVPCPMLEARSPCPEACPVCYGDQRVSPTIEPPSGNWFQMWETVSEGSPISPPCKTEEDLARWLVDHKTYAGGAGEGTATYDEWLAMIRVGWVPSGIFTVGRGYRSGVHACSDGGIEELKGRQS